jgi:hypothetical protein
MPTREPRIEEGVTLSPYTLDVIDLLDRVFDALEAGAEGTLFVDPFYTPQSGPLTEEKIDALIAAIDHEFTFEVTTYASYHRNRSGSNATPEFHRLSAHGRRALAEGLAMLIEEHFPPAPAVTSAGEPPVTPTPAASPTGGTDDSDIVQ